MHVRTATALEPPPGAGLGGRYVLDRILGAGGSADVYAGRDRVLARPVALKWLREGAGADGFERMRAEAGLLARLDHPGLVRLYDSGTEDGRPYLVMELVGPGTLRSALVGGPMATQAVARLGHQLADTLGYLHARGLVHRDLTPSNVLMSGDRQDPGRVWLADLGIARALEAAHLTATGTTVGTAAFLSPEQVRGEAVTPASDIWSLGLVLLECLTGRREYDGSAAESAVARLTRPPVVPAALPEPWAELLQAMLAAEAPLRPGAGDVAARLGALMGSPAKAPAQVVPPRRQDAGLGQSERRTWSSRVAALRWVHVQWALGTALVLLAALGWTLLRWDLVDRVAGGVGPASHHPVPAATVSAPPAPRAVKAQAISQPVAPTASTPGKAPATGHRTPPGKTKGHGHGRGHKHGHPGELDD